MPKRNCRRCKSDKEQDEFDRNPVTNRLRFICKRCLEGEMQGTGLDTAASGTEDEIDGLPTPLGTGRGGIEEGEGCGRRRMKGDSGPPVPPPPQQLPAQPNLHPLPLQPQQPQQDLLHRLSIQFRQVLDNCRQAFDALPEGAKWALFAVAGMLAALLIGLSVSRRRYAGVGTGLGSGYGPSEFGGGGGKGAGASEQSSSTSMLPSVYVGPTPCWKSAEEESTMGLCPFDPEP